MDTAPVETHELKRDAKAERLLRCYYLAAFIAQSVIDSSYKPPVQLSGALRLSVKGAKIANQIKGNSVELREAQVAVFLGAWAGEELLIDVDQVDLETVRIVVSSELKRGKFKLPWAYGRTLYDKIAESSFHGSGHPTAEESAQLLKDMPHGVFQLGPYVSGPYGLLEVQQWRSIFYTHTVPGYHCSKADCKSVHGVHLSVPENGLKRAHMAFRDKTSKMHLLDEILSDEVDRIESSRLPIFRWNNSSRLPYFLFESFTLDELRLLLATLLDRQGGNLRKQCDDHGVKVAAAREFVQNLHEDQLLQILFMAMDGDIHETLNLLIRDRAIIIPEGEIRTARMVSRGAGPHEVTLEASSLGVRYKPYAHNLPLRLQQIIDQAYPLGDERAQSTLRWLLRHYEGESSLAKLTVALAEADPLELVERLLVAGEETYSTALRQLGLPSKFYSDYSDREIARLITWHIGFSTNEQDVELKGLQDGISKLKQVIGSLPATFLERGDIGRMQEVAGQLFPTLEGVLKSTLCFTAWATLHDHYEDSYHLYYSQEQGYDFFNRWVATQPSRLDSPKVEGMALGDLLTCFSLLAKFFDKITVASELHKRPITDWPSSAREPLSPFEFPFEYMYPFLDLTSSSQKALQSAISRVASELMRSNVPSVRNKLLHHRNDAPDRDAISSALASVEARIAELIGIGVYPLLFTPKGSEQDNYGRKRYLLGCESGPEILLTRPIKLMLTGFPSVEHAQIILIGARLRKSGEPLRFTSMKDSAYRDRWGNFPRRPPRRTISGAVASAVDSGNDEPIDG